MQRHELAGEGSWRPRKIPFDFAQGRLLPRLNCVGLQDDATIEGIYFFAVGGNSPFNRRYMAAML